MFELLFLALVHTKRDLQTKLDKYYSTFPNNLMKNNKGGTPSK